MALSLNIPWSERLIWLASAALNEVGALNHLTATVRSVVDATDVTKWITLEARGKGVLLAFLPFLEGYAAFNCRDPLFHQLLSGLMAVRNFYTVGLRIWAYRYGYVPLRSRYMIDAGIALLELTGLAYLFTRATRRKKKNQY